MIFVSAQASGNTTSTLDRRLPLALLAYENVRARFPLDARRVYVAGFSGGARVAEMAELAYPDVFHGALLTRGADPIDGRDGMLPASRRADAAAPAREDRARDRRRRCRDPAPRRLAERSLRDACVVDIDTQIAARTGHAALDQVAFGRALDALEAPHAVDEAALAR